LDCDIFPYFIEISLLITYNFKSILKINFAVRLHRLQSPGSHS